MRKRTSTRKSPAVFFDRDGTLIEDAGYLNDPARIRVYAGTAEALRVLRKAGYRLFVVSNQSGVARGYFPESQVRKVHEKLRALLKAGGARIDRFFYCPHYPGGKVKSYARACGCRKPAPGMVRRAARLYALDLKRSYVVGDKMDDLLLGRRAGLAGGFLVRTGNGRKSGRELGKNPLPGSFPVSGILGAAKRILALSAGNFRRSTR